MAVRFDEQKRIPCCTWECDGDVAESLQAIGGEPALR